MSIEAKHAYRFGYLKSEKWKTVRLEALVREKACCQICGDESVYNDAHHMWYPQNIYETTEAHLVVLCRPCHDFLHAMIPECKTKDEQEGREHWVKFANAIKAWRHQKLQFWKFDGFPSVKDLRSAYEALKEKCENQQSMVQAVKLGDGTLDIDPQFICRTIKKWAKAYANEKEPVDRPRMEE